MVVPGSNRVRAEAEAEGLDAVFRAAGFECVITSYSIHYTKLYESSPSIRRSPR